MAGSCVCSPSLRFEGALGAVSTSLSWGHEFYDSSAGLRTAALAEGLVPTRPEGRVCERPLVCCTRYEPERRQLLVVLAEAWRCLLVERASGRTRTLCLVGSESDVDVVCEVIAATMRGAERCWSEYRHQELIDLLSLGEKDECEVRADMEAHAAEERRDFMTRLVDGLGLAFVSQGLRDDSVRSSFRVPGPVHDYVGSLVANPISH